jgi:SAM-dependent methyltransferase
MAEQADQQKRNFVYRKETWERVAKTDDVYGALCHGWDKARFETHPESLFFYADCPRDAVVVDLGCGIGRVARFVAPLVSRYIGLDYAAAMVTKAREYNAGLVNVEFVESDTLAVLPDESADRIVSEQVFIHCTREQQLRYLGEAYDVLKPGGLLLVSVPHVDHYVNGFDPKELAGLLVKYHVSTTPAGLGFVLRARKPQG